jgi:hypothetical protein
MLKSFLTFIFLLGWSGIAVSADVTRTECGVQIKGEIKTGDANKLKSLIEPIDSVCLDSPGGSYAEALVIARILAEGSTTSTSVGDGHICLSACALIFMMGRAHFSSEGDEPSRRLHVRGKLGFHAPYIDASQLPKDIKLSAADVEKTFASASDAIVQLFGLFSLQHYKRGRTRVESWVNPGLIAQMLRRKKHEFYFVDTVGKAAAWDIDIFGEVRDVTLNSRSLEIYA